jgi:hypothetical protein
MGNGTACLRQLGQTRAGAVRFGRFLHNAAVTREIILETAGEHTARALAVPKEPLPPAVRNERREAARGRHVLAIQDTTELNFSAHGGRKRGFGPVGNAKNIGLFVHPVVVVDAAAPDALRGGAAGGILGLADAFIINRKPGALKPRRDRPIAQKESQRWLDGLNAASRVLAGAAMVTLVADRESDIYEEFAAPRPAHVHLLVRAGQDRLLKGGAKLFESLALQPVAGCQRIDVPAKPGQPARQAKTLVSFAQVEIERPANGFDRKSLPATVKLNAVRVGEIDPPEGVKPVLWLLLTTHAIANLEAAMGMIGWYKQRWTIEQVFRTMKTQGFAIEDSQIVTPAVMAKLATAVLIAALRVMQLVHARSGKTGQKLTDAIDDAAEPLVEALAVKLEGKTERLKNPHARGTLARFAWVIGRLGGWTGYYGKPGPLVMRRGLHDFQRIKHGAFLRTKIV